MRKRISLFVLSNAGHPVRQYRIPKILLRLGLFLLAAASVAIAYGAYDYLRIQKQVALNPILEEQIQRQTAEIRHQRAQIGQFAEEINHLKSSLVDLSRFEQKIRIIANLETNEEQDGVFGVGGPVPEDLDPGIPLEDKYTALMREMHQQSRQLQEASQQQEERFENLLEHLEGEVNLLASTPAIRPAKGWMTAGFGTRKSPFTGLKEFHKGIDIANRKGTHIHATADGKVIYAGKKGLLGNTIIIDHGHGMVTRYGHLAKLLKKKGERVKRGDTIALMGNTGRTTGTHVHYEVMLNGAPVNPRKYILN